MSIKHRTAILKDSFQQLVPECAELAEMSKPDCRLVKSCSFSVSSSIQSYLLVIVARSKKNQQQNYKTYWQFDKD